MEDDERWTVVDDSFTEDDHATTCSGDLASRVSVLREALTARHVEGEDDIIYVSYETDEDEDEGTTLGCDSTDATDPTGLELRLRPFIQELTSTSSDEDDPVTTFRPVVNIAASDVRGHPQELHDQMTDRLKGLLSHPSNQDPSIVSFLESLDTPTKPFSTQDAQTWRELVRAATADGRIAALRPGTISVDPTQCTEYDGVPEDHVMDYYEVALSRVKPEVSVQTTVCMFK
ncbi:hypothetical protein JCM24511_02380 [Saitozyma sp. JCM 24511]|nr:hypothetical protein JCM24511_02380 [Saitozyma sp. JCM 24511]